MLRNHFYYFLKPLLPWSLRVGLRRLRAGRRRRLYAGVWPIDPAAARPPEGWQGWPEGKQFAMVLTHDVEGQLGLDRCRSLVETEEQLGFRSSFNFVPEGEYRVPAELREELAHRGFEVGVHDLAHDGKLYSSRAGFRDRALRINRYLKAWGAVGFRAGFMLHNLGWLHDLEVKYDSSTFDTDPFEPQPDGVGTIFPFWVPGAQGKGYMELPYTLTQDFTAFILFRERTIEVWKRKMDWVAAHGGMVLVNVHPDYITFPAASSSRREFPLALYRELLDYARMAYAGRFWHALPREVADYCAQFRPRHAAATGKRVCMVSYSFYEADNRVLRYAETLQKRGDRVDAIAIQRGSLPRQEALNGVQVQRIQKRTHDEKTRWSYLARLVRFLVHSSFTLARRHLREPYDVIHVHNVPDFLVFAAWLPKLLGARVILDIHDIVPEFYASKFKVDPDSRVCRALRLMERLSMGFADHVIISNHLWHEKVIARSVPAHKCSVCMNHVDMSVFYPRPRALRAGSSSGPEAERNGKFIVVFPGGLQWHQGLDIAIRAFALFQNEIPGAEFHIYGDGQAKPDLVKLTSELGLKGKVRFFGEVPLRKVPEILAQADLGVVPKRANSFGNEAYSTKIMEFMSQGIPVVISRTKIDTYYFQEGQVKFFESGNEADLAQAMVTVVRDPALRQAMVRSGLEYVEHNSWETKKHEYIALVDRLALERH
ncbi:MAG: glycosyltransferase [Verrucomicrobia bacterium]|nr:glycosyltransferase [Verrucomicrobiota bacterium]